MACTEGRVVYSGPELEQVLSPNMMPNDTITLTLSNKISRIKDGSFSRLRLLERPPWSLLPQEAILESRSGLPQETMLMSTVRAATRGQVDVREQGYCRRPHGSP